MYNILVIMSSGILDNRDKMLYIFHVMAKKRRKRPPGAGRKAADPAGPAKHLLTVRVTQDLLDRLDAACGDRSRGELVRAALKRYLHVKTPK